MPRKTKMDFAEMVRRAAEVYEKAARERAIWFARGFTGGKCPYCYAVLLFSERNGHQAHGCVYKDGGPES
jgi:hypothetical protein